MTWQTGKNPGRAAFAIPISYPPKHVRSASGHLSGVKNGRQIGSKLSIARKLAAPEQSNALTLPHWRNTLEKSVLSLFLQDAVDLSDIKPVAHTAFEIDAATSAIDLRNPHFARDADKWQHKTSYAATQDLARSARSANLGAIRYASVRDPQQGECAALLTPAAFATLAPHPVQETWWLQVRRAEVIWRSDRQSFVFAAEH